MASPFAATWARRRWWCWWWHIVAPIDAFLDASMITLRDLLAELNQAGVTGRSALVLRCLAELHDAREAIEGSLPQGAWLGLCHWVLKFVFQTTVTYRSNSSLEIFMMGTVCEEGQIVHLDALHRGCSDDTSSGDAQKKQKRPQCGSVDFTSRRGHRGGPTEPAHCCIKEDKAITTKQSIDWG